MVLSKRSFALDVRPPGGTRFRPGKERGVTAPQPTDPFDFLLIDDHAAFREALAVYFRGQPGIGRVTLAGSVGEARVIIAEYAGALSRTRLVVLLDLHIGPEDGAQLVPEIVGIVPNAVVVVLSAVEDLARLGRVVEPGAVAILSKRTPIVEIVLACRRAAEGRIQLDPAVTVELMMAASGDRVDRESAAQLVRSVSPREREVLQHIAAGLTDREIAAKLHISYDTVRTHVRNTLRKLGVNDRMAAVLFGMRHGLLDDDRPPGPGATLSIDSD